MITNIRAAAILQSLGMVWEVQEYKAAHYWSDDAAEAVAVALKDSAACVIRKGIIFRVEKIDKDGVKVYLSYKR